VHDLTAARTHDLIEALTNANVMTFVLVTRELELAELAVSQR